MFSNDYNILRSAVIGLKNFIQYNHCQVVQLFGLTPFSIKAFTTIIPKHIICPCLVFRLRFMLQFHQNESNTCCKLVEMDFSMTANDTITVEEMRFHETHIAYRLALIHSTCSSNL